MKKNKTRIYRASRALLKRGKYRTTLFTFIPADQVGI